jgi:hypothetical protein
LRAIAFAAVIFTPRGFLRIAEEILACDVVVMSNLGPAHTAEKLLGLIGASAVEAIGL